MMQLLPIQNKLYRRFVASSVFIGLITALVFSASVQAQEFECSTEDDRRFIRLELPGQEHLCEVSVTHLNEVREVKWYANHETLFCSAKIYELRDKYESQWGYQCSEWLDTSGIDELSERHRTILDGELKTLIKAGQNATPQFRVTGVKAVASNPLNLAPGALAVQYFMQEITATGDETPRDMTRVIFDDGAKWRAIAQLDSLSEYVGHEYSGEIASALVHGISDGGMLHVNTTLASPVNAHGQACQGVQLLLVSENAVALRSPHRVTCID